MKKKLLLTTALVAFAMAPYAVKAEPREVGSTTIEGVTQWSDNVVNVADNHSREGGLLFFNNHDHPEEKIVDKTIKGNVYTTSRVNDSEALYAQGSALKIIGNSHIAGFDNVTFENNKMISTTRFVSKDQKKVTANGGVIGLWNAAIDRISGKFVGNSAEALYVDETGKAKEGYDGKTDSAGGGAIHAEGQYGGGASAFVGIKEINADFIGNHASGMSYGNGGAIYYKAGADINATPPSDLIETNITGDFIGNYAEGKTSDATAKASSGGAITVKRSGTNSANLKLTGTLKENYVSTKATQALGGAVFNGKGNGVVTFQDSSFEKNYVTSESGSALGGAVYNEKGATMAFVGNTTFAGNKAQGKLNDIHNDGTITVNGTLTLDGGVTGEGGKMTFAKGSKLVVGLGTTAITGNEVVNEGADLSLVFKGDYTGKYALIGEGASLDKEFAVSGTNSLYNIKTTDVNGTYDIAKKTGGEIAQAAGITENQGSAIGAMTSSAETKNETFNDISDEINTLMQSGSKADVKKAADMATALAPETAPMVSQTQTETANQVFGAVSSRFSGASVTTAKQGASSGDSDRGALWAQGLYNESDLDDTNKSKGFDAKTSGIALGFEKSFSDNLKAGLGYAYTESDIDGYLRSTDSDTHTAMLYGEYTHKNWFTNAVVSYGWSNYKETKEVSAHQVKADYDAETLGIQSMTGYLMNLGGFGIVPEGGLRYLHVNQDSYKDSAGQKVASSSSDILTGVLGGKINKTFDVNGKTFVPEFSVKVTYDIKNDKGGSVITLANGSSYQVSGEALDRWGSEVGAGLTFQADDHLEFSISYEGKFREDYQDHTGMLNAKFNF